MAKLTPSRLDGVYGMRKFTAEELHDAADANVVQIGDPKNTDDPRWLWRWSKKLRWLARKKEKAREHKSRQRKPSNQSVELTATRRTLTFSMTKTSSLRAALVLGGGSSLLSR